MTALTIPDASRRSGLSEPTLRYYEQVGLIGPIIREPSSGHRRYQPNDLEGEIAARHTRLEYLREKAALWDARDRGDAAAEAEAAQRVMNTIGRLEVVG